MAQPPGAKPTVPMTPAVYQILLALADEDRHGYGIMQEVITRTGDDGALGPGTLYRSIKRLRQVGWIKPVGVDEDGEDERRRYYRVTRAGRAALANEARRLSQLVAQAEEKRVLDEAAS